MSKKDRLTPREERFVGEYFIDLNGTAAYRRAFPNCTYNTARTEAARLLAKPCIRAAVRAARRDWLRRNRVTADRVLRAIGEIAFSDLGDVFDLSKDGWEVLPPRRIPRGGRRAVASLRVQKLTTRTRTAAGGEVVIETVESVAVRMVDKLRALDMLMRHLGLYKEPTPLEELLAALPPNIAKAVRRALAEELRKTDALPTKAARPLPPRAEPSTG